MRPELHPWTSLLPVAEELLRRLPPDAQDGLTFGGGSGLALAIAHRLSKDLDLFHTDIQVLAWLSPRLHHDLDTRFPNTIEGANFLKFPTHCGELDIIVAPHITKIHSSQNIIVGHLHVSVEPPAEIIAKKILYRGSEAKLRDLFDLAAVMVSDPKAIIEAGQACGEKAIERFRLRAERLLPRLPELLPSAIAPLPGWERFAKDVAAVLPEALARLGEAARASRSNPIRPEPPRLTP